MGEVSVFRLRRTTALFDGQVDDAWIATGIVFEDGRVAVSGDIGRNGIPDVDVFESIDNVRAAFEDGRTRIIMGTVTWEGGDADAIDIQLAANT